MVREWSTAAIAGITVAALAVVGGLLILTMWIFGYGLLAQNTADFRGETAKKNSVEANGDYHIAAYDHFYDLCTGIQTDEAAVSALQDELKTHPSDSRREQIQASITANRITRQSSIAEYNNDARKSYTSGQFRDSKLPFHLDAAKKETSCTL